MWMVWTLSALIAGLVLGAAGARWRIERRRQVADHEDNRDTQIRELLAALKVTRRDASRAREEMAAATSDAAESTRRIEELEQRLEAAERQQNGIRDRLNGEIAEKSGLQDALTRSRRENEALKTRVQELELELRAGATADLLDPALQMR